MGTSRKLLTGVATLLAVASGHAANFTNLVNLTNGAEPFAGLVLSGNTLFGTTFTGGAGSGGTAFAVATDGSAFTNLHSFGTVPGEALGPGFGAPLVLTNNTLYGVLDGTGGGGGHGAIFAISTDGSITTNVYAFTSADADGIQPEGGLILSGSTLFGTTYYGGGGTIFAVNTNGTGFTNLYRFSTLSFGDGTNSDGANPPNTLLLSGDTLYGVTDNGGIYGFGTVFAVSTNGTGFTNLHNFDVYGYYANGSLIQSGNTLYGTLSEGGTNRIGMVFAINTNGMGFTNIYSFTAEGNSEAANPYGGVILSGSTLYGTTRYGGDADRGAVFAVNTDGTGFTNLHNFTGGDGSYPTCVLILSSNTLYGTTSLGGSAGRGTVFSLTLTPTVVPIPLTIQFDGSAATLSWNGPGFSLQSAPSITGVYSNVAGATSPYTNYISSSQMFFRLQSN